MGIDNAMNRKSDISPRRRRNDNSRDKANYGWSDRSAASGGAAAPRATPIVKQYANQCEGHLEHEVCRFRQPRRHSHKR
jgi:hypothetical protein